MPPSDLNFRTATLDDVPVILHHRRSMFRDMGNSTPDELDKMVEATRSWLQRSLADGSYRGWLAQTDRKSTRLNSSHLGISYAVFCLQKKTAHCNRTNALEHSSDQC